MSHFCDKQSLNSYVPSGPSSFLSICSIPGLEWVTERTGESSFVGSARTLATSITQRLKLPQNVGRGKAPEPDAATAWGYCKGLELYDAPQLCSVALTSPTQLTSNIHLRPAWGW